MKESNHHTRSQLSRQRVGSADGLNLPAHDKSGRTETRQKKKKKRTTKYKGAMTC